MNQTSLPPFRERVEHALQDQELKSALVNAQKKFRTGRNQAAEDLGNVEEWRVRAEAIRAHTIQHLDYYLEQFSTNVEKKGGKVFFAETDQEAIDYVLRIAKEKKAKTVIKSKSMVSEEMHLNTCLEKIGVQPIESDLGEYIIQLAKEMPSHIIAPAIHKNRKQIAELFSKVAGETLPEDTPTLTRFARELLRKKFLQADIGISGCNFAIADSGAMILVSNEGNGRLTTTLPKTHIVLMGMERIVPSFEDVDVVLSLLPRSATGQRITSYVTALAGPKKDNDIDGPEEVHVIIVDNGRSNALGTKYQSILHCIRCGACLNVCPVYRHIGGHAYGGVYPGPIGAVLTPILKGFDGWEELPYASSLCGACTDVCPVKIPLHDMLIDLRNDQVESKRTDKFESFAFKTYASIMQRPSLYKLALKLSKYPLKPFTNQEGYIEKGVGPLKQWTKARDLPAPASTSFREWWQAEGKKGGKADG
ncbi:LutB/LldF family L-lactate oxidation iron-sulfur protein [Caldalkalibacillus mannanilyticus]|uniref:LutB/LldF family L-lactate oxidation iron-sulfur protein n=1 Tax=Caldalkalibacillus mannanilyticus TaxID=1418 RepID=UPI0004696518|nr:LutB/LldF family L-lactate oxidation iron-sulfur protein [Caldalkalibacillus mannanilyticus]